MPGGSMVAPRGKHHGLRLFAACSVVNPMVYAMCNGQYGESRNVHHGGCHGTTRPMVYAIRLRGCTVWSTPWCTL